MPRIYRKRNFFRTYYFYFFGSLNLFFSIVLFIIEEANGLRYLYLCLALGFLSVGYLKRNSAGSFIEWDQEKVVLAEYHQEPQVFLIENIDDILFSETQFTIKSGPAGGTMMDNKGFKKEDLKKFKFYFQNYSFPQTRTIATKRV